MAVSVVQLVANGGNNTNNTTASAAITNVPTIGNHLICIERHVSATTLSSVGDTVSSWQVDHNGNVMSFSSAKVTGDLTGKTFTLTYSGNTTGKIFWIFEVSGLDSTWFGSADSAQRVSQGTARNFGSNIITPASVGDLIVACWAATLSTETSLTAASGYTNLPGVTGDGYYEGAFTNWIEGVWRAAASTSAQEPTATGGASPSAYRAIVATYKASTTQNATVTGVRATATAAVKAGTPRISVTGTRAAASAPGRPGTAKVNVTGVRALASAAGNPGTPKVVVGGVCAAAGAASNTGTPRVSVTGTRAAATAAGRPGSARTAVSGARAEAYAARYDNVVTVEESVTLTSGLNVHDGVVYIPGKGLFGIVNSTPATIVKWADVNDLATYTTKTFANDGKHGCGGSNCIVYDSNTDTCYVTHTAYSGFGGGDNNGIVISSFDPDDINTIATVADFDTGSVFAQSFTSVVMTGGYLYLLTRPLLENSRLYKVDPSTGSVSASTQVGGTNHQRGHPLATDGTRLYFGGTPGAGAWVGWAELDLSATDTLDLGTGKTVSDDLTVIGSYFYVNLEQETTPSGTVKKIATDLSSSSDISIGYLTGVDGQYYDGTYLWVTSNGNLISSGSQPSALVRINVSTGAVTDFGQLGSGQTKTNEIAAVDSDTFVLTTFQTPAQAYRVSVSSVLGVPPGTPKVAVTGVRALATATGKPGTVTTGTGSSNATVTGVRAEATAAGRAGTPKVSVTGSRSTATAAGTSGTPKVTVTGVRALASATGTAGTPKVVLLGARATATAAGTVGSPKVSILGVRALATATASAGTPKVAVTGTRALAAATGNAGSASAPGNKSVTGVRATATASGTAGTPKVAVTGTRAEASATGTAGTPKVCVTGVRALASATGNPGSVSLVSSVSVTGSRALCTATGTVGTPKVCVTGTRATASAAGSPGGCQVAVTGVRAACTATGTSGSPRIQVTGARAICTATGNAGSVGRPAHSGLTRRTRTSGPGASTILATQDGRTSVSIGGSRTRVGNVGRGARVSIRPSRTDSDTPPTG